MTTKTIRTAKPKFTAQQEAIREYINSKKTNLVVQARAGTGKSSTIRMTAPKNSVILCFNRAPADEMQTELSERNVDCTATTFHTFGLRQFPSRPVIDDSKTHWLCRDILFHGQNPVGPDGWGRLAAVKKAVSWAKSQAAHPDVDISRLKVILQDERLDIELSPDEIVEDTLRILQACAEPSKSKAGKAYWKCDFDDMQWLPFINEWGKGETPNLFVDEAQDLNPIRVALAMLWGQRLFAVGDARQAIYAFQGSMSNSLDLFQEMISATQLPLTVCWRCPSSHLDRARELVPDIMDRPDVPGGIVDDADKLDDISFDNDIGSLVLCRTNAPLIGAYYRMRKSSNLPVVMMSRDIAGTLCSFIGNEKYDVKKPLDAAWEAKFTAKFEKNIMYARTESSKLVLQDHYAALTAIRAEHVECRYIGELHAAIHAEFDRPEIIPDNAIRLSTIHGAKGLEHNNVVVYGTSMIPHPMAETPWEREQEFNLKYISLTRSKDTLTLIPDLI